MSTHALHTRHERSFEANRFVYPVLSRRAGGLSVGVNLNPDKICNFDCIYCQVDRTRQSETRFVEIDALLVELEQMLQLAASGAIWETEKFRAVPAELQRVTDIAFSGDGEPTTYKNFDEIVAACAELKGDAPFFGNSNKTGEPETLASGAPNQPAYTGRSPGILLEPQNLKLVLITNASMFHRPHVERALAILDENSGEIWAKLDAGTEEYFKLINRTPIPFRRILDNIGTASKVRPLVIQSLFMQVNGQPPPREELDAYCDRLREITAKGGQIKLVQVCTVARSPAESYVSSLSDYKVDVIVEQIVRETGLTASAFYG